LENDDAGTYNFSAIAGSVFGGNPGARFDDGTFGTYNVAYPDRLTPLGGASAALTYGASTVAAIQWNNQLIYLGFPFETITTAVAREAYMLDVLKYFDILPKPIILAFDPQSATLSWQAIPGKRYRVQYKNDLAVAAWSTLAGDVIATSHIVTRVDSTVSGLAQRFYRVLMLEP
jgi:hypothetical protein